MHKSTTSTLRDHRIDGDQVCALTDTSQSTLAMLVDGGFVTPTWPAGSGSVTRDHYSITDTIRIGLMRVLRTHGLSLKNASAFAFGQDTLPGIIETEIDAFFEDVRAGLQTPSPPRPTSLILIHSERDGVEFHRVLNAEQDYGGPYNNPDAQEVLTMTSLTRMVWQVMRRSLERTG